MSDAYILQIRGGVSRDRYGKKAGKGALVKHEHAPCIAAAQDTILFATKTKDNYEHNNDHNPHQRIGTMNYLSVCSGVEAASQAWEPLGWKAVAFSEIEPFPCAVLASRFPDVPNLGDMSKIHYNHETKELTNGTIRIICDNGIDLLVGGTPCQSFSVAGKRAGLEGASGLAYHYARLIGEIRPKWFVWENVPGALSSVTYGDQRDFNFLLQQFSIGGDADLGIRYDCCWRVLDTQYVRVESYPRAIPQRRRRVFVVGHLTTNGGGGCEVLLEREGVCGNPPPSRVKGQGVARYTAEGAGGADDAVGVVHGTMDPISNPCEFANAVGRNIGQENCVAMSFKGGQSSRGGLGVDGGACQTMQSKMSALEPTVAIRSVNTVVEGAHAESVETYPIDMRNATRNTPYDGQIHREGVGIGDAKDPCPTLSTMFTPSVAYGINPQNGDRGANGQAVCCFQQNQRDEVRNLGEASGALASNSGAHQTNYLAFKIDAKASNSQGESKDTVPKVAIGIDQQGGKGNAGFAVGTMPTICSNSHGTPHAVAIGIGRDAFNSGRNAQMAQSISDEVQPPITAKGPGGGYAPMAHHERRGRDADTHE